MEKVKKKKRKMSKSLFVKLLEHFEKDFFSGKYAHVK